MSHQFLHHRDVAATADEVDGKGVSELMDVEADSRCLADALDKDDFATQLLLYDR